MSPRHIDEIIAGLIARGYLTAAGYVVGPASSVDNRVAFFDGITGKLIKDSGLTLAGVNTGDQTSIVGITGTLAQFNTALTGADFASGGGTATGTNTGDQTSIVGITGTLAEFNTALTGADFATGGGTATGTNTGDQTSIVGITGTKAQFDAACITGDFLYVGDVTQYTDEMAQDAVGAMVDGTLVYVDATPLLQRAAISGHVTIAAGSNNATLGSFTSAQLGAALSSSTGSGLAVFGTGPTLTAPFFSSPQVSAGTFFTRQPAPASKAAAATLTAAEILDGIIQYTGPAANLTLPTGTLTDTAVGALTTLAGNMAFDFYIINTSAATVTLAAGATFTILGTATVLTGISACFRCRRTAANTWVAMRI
jgi:hypothetical protein